MHNDLYNNPYYIQSIRIGAILNRLDPDWLSKIDYDNLRFSHDRTDALSHIFGQDNVPEAFEQLQFNPKSPLYCDPTDDEKLVDAFCVYMDALRINGLPTLDHFFIGQGPLPDTLHNSGGLRATAGGMSWDRDNIACGDVPYCYYAARYGSPATEYFRAFDIGFYERLFDSYNMVEIARHHLSCTQHKGSPPMKYFEYVCGDEKVRYDVVNAKMEIRDHWVTFSEAQQLFHWMAQAPVISDHKASPNVLGVGCQTFQHEFLHDLRNLVEEKPWESSQRVCFGDRFYMEDDGWFILTQTEFQDIQYMAAHCLRDGNRWHGVYATSKHERAHGVEFQELQKAHVIPQSITINDIKRNRKE